MIDPAEGQWVQGTTQVAHWLFYDYKVCLLCTLEQNHYYYGTLQ